MVSDVVSTVVPRVIAGITQSWKGELGVIPSMEDMYYILFVLNGYLLSKGIMHRLTAHPEGFLAIQDSKNIGGHHPGS